MKYTLFNAILTALLASTSILLSFHGPVILWALYIGWTSWAVLSDGSYPTRAMIVLPQLTLGITTALFISWTAGTLAPSFGSTIAFMTAIFFSITLLLVIAATVPLFSQVPILFLGMISYFAQTQGKLDFHAAAIILMSVSVGIIYGMISSLIYQTVGRKQGTILPTGSG